MRKLILFLLTLLPFSVSAQTPSAEWRTVETEHFRVHYPQPYEAWAHEVTARLESTRERVAARIGFLPNERVDVIVADPEATANGSAWPALGWPRIVLWTSPPEPESSIGSFRDWREMLVTHEQAHVIHLARPSRNPMKRFLSRIFPLGPLTGAPRWVIEGYATVIEGELTGSGRPFGAMRASVLRSWGRSGRLPSYERLASDSSTFMGMSMAYLAGSAYLEWLQQRSGQDSLPKLWRRMSARENRSFDAAFRGVFGASPRDLYARFTAETTAAALAEERSVTQRVEGEVWQDLDWSTDPPALSPDGALLSTVLRSRTKPAKLVIFSTAPVTEEEEKFDKRISRMLERDPEDVAPVRSSPLARKVRHTLAQKNGGDPRDPRFSHDGKSIFFHQLEPDDDGVLHADLFRWHFDEGKLERLTERADLREADPSSDGKSVVAVRNRHGRSSIVRLDLTTGDITDVIAAAAGVLANDADVSEIYSRPRWSRDGMQIAVIRHAASRWQPVVVNVQSGRVEAFEVPGDVVGALAWSSDDRTLYTAIAENLHFNLASIDLISKQTQRLTNSLDPAFAPEISRDGKLIYFLSLDADGFDISTIAVDDNCRPARAAGTLPCAPTRVGTSALDVFESGTAVLPSSPPQSEAIEAGASRPYRLGRQEMLPLASANVSRSSESLELGLRLGDVIGRIDTVILGAIGSQGSLRGASIASSFKGFPVEISAHLYRAEQEAGKRRFEPGEAPGSSRFDFEENGLELRGTKRFGARARSLTVAGGLLYTDREESARPTLPQLTTHNPQPMETQSGARAFLETSWQWRPRLKSTRLMFEAESAVSAGNDETLVRAGGRAGATIGNFTLAFEGALIDGSGDSSSVYLGGTESSIQPRSVHYDRIIDPAYAVGARAGSDGSRMGVTLRLANGLQLFAREDEFNGLRCCEARARSWGGEIRTGIAPFPLLRLPGVALHAGAARVDVGQPWERTSYWFVTVIRP